MDFCEIDGSRLTTEYTNSGIIKKCYMCGTMKDSKAEDTLILTEYIKKKKHNNNIEFLKNLTTNTKYPFSTPELREEL